MNVLSISHQAVSLIRPELNHDSAKSPQAAPGPPVGHKGQCLLFQKMLNFYRKLTRGLRGAETELVRK